MSDTASMLFLFSEVIEILKTGTALCFSTPSCDKDERYINKETPVGRADEASFLFIYSLHLFVSPNNVLSGNNWCNSINSTKWMHNFFVIHKIVSFLEATTYKAVAWSKAFLSVISHIQSLENSVGFTFNTSLESQHFLPFLLPSP